MSGLIAAYAVLTMPIVILKCMDRVGSYSGGEDSVFYEMTPMLAAVSSLLVFANIIAVSIFMWMRSRLGRSEQRD